MSSRPTTAGQIGDLDVLFILPPHFRLVGETFFNFPLGLGYLVSYLRERQFVSAIFNMDAPRSRGLVHRIVGKLRQLGGDRWHDYARKWDLFYKRVADLDDPIWAEVEVVLRKTNPKIVGINATIVSMPCVFNIARAIKRIDPKVKVVLGGPAATTIPDHALSNDCVDYLVYGEGEASMADLTGHILRGETSLDALKTIDGIIFKNGTELIKTPPRPLIRELDKLTFPDRDSMFDLDDGGRLRKVHSTGDVLGSRGCPYLCKFCACFTIWGNRIPRLRSVDNILQEVEHAVSTYGQTSFIFWDDLFTASKKRVKAFCEEILRRDLRIDWVCLARLNTLDREMVDLMKRAGCSQVQVGVESGSDRILKFIGKDLTVALISEKTKILRDAGINWLAFIIVGFPTETRDEIRQTLDFIEELGPDSVAVSVFSPYPGTEFGTYLDEKGLFDKEGQFMKNDTWYTGNNYTGTMSDDEFSRLALEALKLGDEYNRRRGPSVASRVYRYARRLVAKALRTGRRKPPGQPVSAGPTGV